MFRGHLQQVFLRIFACFLAVSAPMAFADPRIPDAPPADEVTRDFLVRGVGTLRLTNFRGRVEVQGWVQDRIRIRLKRRYLGEVAEESEKWLKTADLKRETSLREEAFSIEYGRGLSLEDRLRDRAAAKVRVDLVVQAPFGMKLFVWGSKEGISLKDWRDEVELKLVGSEKPDAASAPYAKVDVERVKAKFLRVHCWRCSLSAKKLETSLQVSGAEGGVTVEDLTGERHFLETGEGLISLKRVRGEQLYTTSSGRVEGADLQGKIDFRSKSGTIELRDSSGFFSARTDEGNIFADFRDWEFVDKAFLDAPKGTIELMLPRTFSGELDLQSSKGRIFLEGFVNAVSKTKRPALEGTQGRMTLALKDGALLDPARMIRLQSETGNIHVRERKDAH